MLPHTIIEIINNTRGGIEGEIGSMLMGQIEVPDVLDNENCTALHNIELSVLYFQCIQDLNLPPISVLPFMTVFNGSASL